METVIILGIYVIEMLKYSLAFRIIYNEQIKKYWSYFAGGALLLVYMYIEGGNSERDYIVAYVLVLAMTVFGMYGKAGERILRTLISGILLVLIDEIPSAMLSCVELQYRNVIHIHSVINILASIWGLAVLIIFFLLSKKKREKLFWNMNRVRLVVIVNGVVLSLTVAELNVVKEKFTRTGFQAFADITTTIAYVSLSLLCCLVLYFRDQDEHKSGLLEIEKELMDAQTDYYQLLLQKEEDTRKFRHDIKNHLLCLNNLAGKGDLDGLKKYLGEMYGQIEQISSLTYTTGNELVDIILNDKFYAFDGKIKIQIIGSFCNALNISEMDLCIIFSNIFQNAAEELSGQEQGWFEIQITLGNQFTEIIIQNSVNGKTVMQGDGFPQTRKGDTRNHGIGLRNVKAVVERNNGYFEIISKESRFGVKIQLQNDH
jgi:hypothetical protein